MLLLEHKGRRLILVGELPLGSASMVTLIRHGDLPSVSSVSRTMDLRGDRVLRASSFALRFVGEKSDSMEIGSGDVDQAVSFMSRLVVDSGL